MTFRINPLYAGRTAGFFVEKCWLIRARCGACGHESRLSAERLAEFPAGVTIGEIVARLKCSACGAQVGEADVLQDRGATVVRDLERYERDPTKKI